MRKRDLIIEFLQLITGIGLKKGKKAAPRFELGIKDLQSSALPLGHAAVRDSLFPSADRISDWTSPLLVVSNGHGEDLIALRVLEALHALKPDICFEVIPLVGEGKAFDQAIASGWLRRIGPLARLPSGGFSNQSFVGLCADIASGLIGLSFNQWKIVRHAAVTGRKILAVGDFLPLLFAWSSGGCYGFIGTPKSDYTWRSGPGKAFSDYYHSLKGTEWDPWEWHLMRSSRCEFVAVRDRLTARGLKRHGVIALALGNPMMDGLKAEPIPTSLKNFRRLLLLCGSRVPEALTNFKRLLDSLELLNFQYPLAILVPIGSNPSLKELQSELLLRGYSQRTFSENPFCVDHYWEKGEAFIIIGVGQFSRWASWVEIGIANAGTATEQLVGLGIPALSLPGKGPQFTKGFAIRQSRLLGGAVTPCRSKEILAEKLSFLLVNSQVCKFLGKMGLRRMGLSGGSSAVAAKVLKML